MTGSLPDAARAVPARAALTVGAVHTEYLRFGHGAPLLVLDPRIAADLEAGTVPAVLRGMRLIVPVRTTIEALATPAADGHVPFDRWLRGMIDGLGLHELTVLVAPALEPDLRRFAAAHPGEIVAVLPAPR